jgi:hypothetical protein
MRNTAIHTPHQKSQRILFSARDTAAAFFMAPLIEAAHQHPRFEPSIVAQGLAVDILRKNLSSDISLTTLSDQLGLDDLNAVTASLLKSRQPDIVVTGLSSPKQAGIDEVLVKQAMIAKTCSISTVQDFWGECNFLDGVKPQRLFVQDAFAKTRTEARHKVPCIVVGSTRHDRYAQIDPAQLRLRYRETIKADSSKVLTFLGQSLHQVPGYHEHLHALGQCMEGLCKDVVSYYRPHPRESESDIKTTLQFLNQGNARVDLAHEADLESVLCGSDISISMFSNCLYDAAYLNRVSKEPITNPVSVILSSHLQTTLKESFALDINDLPYASTGIASVVRPDETFNISELMDVARQKRAWENAQTTLKRPGDASHTILEHLLKS